VGLWGSSQDRAGQSGCGMRGAIRAPAGGGAAAGGGGGERHVHMPTSGRNIPGVCVCVEGWQPS
jgi:hypothetical protein